MFINLSTAWGQSDDELVYAFDKINQYQAEGKVVLQVCEMMNTESLLSMMDLDQAEKGQYYMKICLTEVDLEGINEETEIQGRALEYRGIRHYVHGEFEQAVEAFDRSLVALTPYGFQYRIHRWLGLIHSMSENVSLGIRHYEDAIFHAVKYYDEDDPQGDAFIFSLHSNITSIYAKLENFRVAKFHAHRATEYAKKISDKSLVVTATINEANILINEKKAEKALKMVATIDSLITDDMQIAANYYNILGTAYQKTKEYDLSIQNLKKSNMLISGNSVLQESMILNWLAIAEAKYLKGSYTSALEETQKVIRNLETKSTRFYSSLADAYHLKAKCLVGKKDLKNAETAIAKAISIEGPFDSWKLPQLSTIMSIKAAQYLTSKKKQDLTSLIRYQDMMDSLILDLQVQHRHYEDELNLNEYIYNAYSSNLDIMSDLHKELPNKFGSNMIFKYMETLKLLTLRNERKVNINGLNIPSELLNQVSELKFELIKLQKDRYELEQSDEDISSIDSIYTSTKYNYYAVLDILESEYPQYYKGQYEKVNTDLSKVQNIIKPSEMIIEYFLSEKMIHVIGITNDSLFFVSNPKPADWRQLISEFRQSLSDVDYISQHSNYQEVFDKFTEYAYRLNNLLFSGLTEVLKDDIKELKIIPDNELYYIPFELLLTDHATSNSYQTLVYLGLLYDISYSESTNYLFQSLDKAYDHTYTVITPNYNNAQVELIPLPNTYQSAVDIHKNVGGDIINEDNEAKMYLSSNSSSIFHFAGHAGIAEDPSLSRLMLANENIYTSEIYQSGIQSQLTILSACNTGSGDFINGRGLQSLSRAFRFAGAQSTIQSLWPVPDFQTARMNNMLFSNLQSGLNIQDALQKAKFDLLQDSPKLYSHPFYWAGFVTFGDSGQTIDLAKEGNNMVWYIGFLLIILVVFLSIHFYRSSKSS